MSARPSASVREAAGFAAAMSARRCRKQASAKYRPEHVGLLLIAEAPPNNLARYFYFEDVAEHDGLFRHVVRAVLDKEPTRPNKASLLQALKACGVFLIDLKPDPKESKDEDLSPYVTDLVDRTIDLRPEMALLIKVNVYDLAFGALRDAGVEVVDKRMPFPASGRQREFMNGMACALKTIGWTADG